MDRGCQQVSRRREGGVHPVSEAMLTRRLAIGTVALVFGCRASQPHEGRPTPSAAPAPAPITVHATLDSGSVERLAPNVVCGRLGLDCAKTAIHTFAAHELPFNPQVREKHESLDSLPFYAVILETQPASPGAGDPTLGVTTTRPCGGFFPEVDRLDAQQHFGAKRVFASRHGCTESRIVYVGIAPTENILAVFAGDTEADARAVLAVALTRWSTAKLVTTQVQLLTLD